MPLQGLQLASSSRGDRHQATPAEAQKSWWNRYTASLVVLSLALIPASSLALPLSPGDRIKITIPEGEEFSGIFEVNIDGKLEIPYLPPLQAAGLEPEQIRGNLRLTRNGRTSLHDLSGILSGRPFQDVPVIAGDQIEVPSTGAVNPALVRPLRVRRMALISALGVMPPACFRDVDRKRLGGYWPLTGTGAWVVSDGESSFTRTRPGTKVSPLTNTSTGAHCTMLRLTCR